MNSRDAPDGVDFFLLGRPRIMSDVGETNAVQLLQLADFAQPNA
jgi:hypothetical protein